MSEKRFEGRVALVTGAAGGIGRAAALAFAHAGASLVLADVAEAGGEETAEMARAHGVQTLFQRTDVSVSAEVADLVRAGVARFGRLDHAFNNAGVTSTADDWDEERMLRMLSINLNGVMFGMKHQIAQMLAQGGGTIVNNASVAGLSAAGTAEYVASKHGVVGLTRAAGVRYARQGVRINAVCPGVIDTDMTRPLMQDAVLKARIEGMCPIGRVGQPQEVADAVLWLSSPDSSFVVAHALPVDGGFMAT
jgi:NAD(P)-dependent dehydrogenase (short-subunit alcohol dehydrogenase family)